MKLKVMGILLLVVLLLPLNVSAAELNFCGRTAPIWQFIGYFLFALKIVVPLLIIVLGIVDFAKAIASSDDKAISTAGKSLLRRFIAGIIIFFVPTIIKVVFDLISNFTGDVLTSIEECQECLLSPTSTACDGYASIANAEADQWFT